MYKEASRKKTRFATSKGSLSAEQLWDLSIADLDTLAVSLDEAYNDLLKYTELYQEIELIKGYSEEIILKYPDNYFDMIYVDADHSYYGCKRDLQICYKKIKP